MSLPRFFLEHRGEVREGVLLPLDSTQARHLSVLRVRTGDAVELVFPGGAWRADLAELGRDKALVRLVGPLEEEREALILIHAWIPVTVQLSLVDELLPPLVELGATLIQPVVYQRSEYDPRKTAARSDRWRRILASACEQSHRTRIPVFGEVLPFEALLAVTTPQRWVAYELPTEARNPTLRYEPLAFTSGPEGGITEEEYEALRGSGWQAVSLGRAILRAVTAPVALLGAVQFQLEQFPGL